MWWCREDMNSSRMFPGGKTDGMKFVARYGYVGLSVEQKEFVAEGLNEAGLSAGLFLFSRLWQI